jgi:hypothetical protein
MEFSQVKLERRGPGESGRDGADSDPDDLYAEEVTGVLLGFAGVLTLVVLLVVVASVGVATSLLRSI